MARKTCRSIRAASFALHCRAFRPVTTIITRSCKPPDTSRLCKSRCTRHASSRSTGTRTSPRACANGWATRAATGKAILWWSRRRTSATRPRLKGHPKTCTWWSGGRASPMTASIIVSQWKIRPRGRAPGRRRFTGRRPACSTNTPVTKITTACTGSWQARARRKRSNLRSSEGAPLPLPPVAARDEGAFGTRDTYENETRPHTEPRPRSRRRHSQDHLVLDDERRERDGVAVLGFFNRRIPEQFARLPVERHEVGVQSTHVQPVAQDRRTTVHHAAANPEYFGQRLLVVPDLASRTASSAQA